MAGPDGLLKLLMRAVPEIALDEEMNDHLGYDKDALEAHHSGNGGWAGVDTVVLSLYVKGLTTGEISMHFAEVYGASLSKDRFSVITDPYIDCRAVPDLWEVRRRWCQCLELEVEPEA